MNTVKHAVTEVKSKPYFNHLWCVDVLVDSWGNISKSTVHCSSEAEAKKVKPGYNYEA